MFLFRAFQPDIPWPNIRLLSIPLLMAMAPKDFFFPKNPVSIKQTLYIQNS